jgi:GWxTD domain-containing protein
MQAGVEVLILLKQGETIANYEKYALNSPVVARPEHLLDVKRFMLKPGAYTLEVLVTDLNNPESKDVYTTTVTAEVPPSKTYLSEVQLLRSYRPDNSESPFTKNGFYLEPLPFNFYDRGATRLLFYAETYHSLAHLGADNTYLVRYVIEQELGNGATKLISMGNQRKKASPIDAVLVQMDISKLESGNYSLKVELRNNSNELLAERKVIFQRSNPFLNLAETELTDEVLQKQFTEQLTEQDLVFCLRGIAALQKGTDNETVRNILQTKDPKAMRFFVFKHFMGVDPNNPEQAYTSYVNTLKQVDDRFHSGFRYGFETDRGVAFMKYGRPDDFVHVEDEPSAPPYEIWIYYNFPATNQKNVKFLFYNPTLAGEDYILLHSTARGEINNPKWERTLYARNAGEEYDGDNYHDATRMQDNLNRNARRYFEDF